MNRGSFILFRLKLDLIKVMMGKFVHARTGKSMMHSTGGDSVYSAHELVPNLTPNVDYEAYDYERQPESGGGGGVRDYDDIHGDMMKDAMFSLIRLDDMEANDEEVAVVPEHLKSLTDLDISEMETFHLNDDHHANDYHHDHGNLFYYHRPNEIMSSKMTPPPQPPRVAFQGDEQFVLRTPQSRRKKLIKKVRKINQNDDDVNHRLTLEPNENVQVYEFEVHSSSEEQNDEKQLQTIQVEGDLPSFEFNYVVDLINGGFFNLDGAVGGVHGDIVVMPEKNE